MFRISHQAFLGGATAAGLTVLAGETVKFPQEAI